MFTGIITDIGTVRSAEQRGDLRLTIGCSYDLATVDLGASIACSGVCLTVVDKGPDWFAVDVSARNRLAHRRRTCGRTAPGSTLNARCALGDEFGGHLVTGHVDGVGTVLGAAIEDGSMRFSIAAPARLARSSAKRAPSRSMASP